MFDRQTDSVWYLVKWQNQDAPTWEPAEHLFNCGDLIDAFRKRAADEVFEYH